MADPSPTFIPREPAAFRSSGLVVSGGIWLFNLGLAALAASLLVAGGLFFYQRALENTAAQWAGEVAAQEAELRPELLAQITDLSTAIAVGRELLAGHVFSSNVLVFLQAVTHPLVQFTAFSYSRDAAKIELSGLANSYRSVAEQVSIIESHAQVAQVGFGGLSRGDKGLVNFRLSVIFKPSLLQLRSE